MAGDRADWTLEAQLLAGVLDVVRTHQWWAIEIARDSDKGRHPYGERPPEPLPRPGLDEAAKEEDRRPVGRNQARARLEAMDREREWLRQHAQETT